jgi:hypothetical protein
MVWAAAAGQANAFGVLEALGGFSFGAVIGWFLYYVNRHRGDTIGISDVGTLLAAVGGAGVCSLFPDDLALFSWYAIGLAVGFFTYFLVLVLMVRRSGRFTVDFFLDGRAPKLAADEQPTAQRPLGPAGGERK